MTLKRRYKPSWGDEPDNTETLLGYVGPLDIYYENNYENNGQHWCIVIGPKDRKLRGEKAHNFDVYVIKDRRLLEPHGSMNPQTDIHIYLHEMCEITQLLIDEGYMDG